jgi:uroporphyrinogen decarboxylase
MKGNNMKKATHNQRWQYAVSHKILDRLPIFYSATEEFTNSLKQYLGLGLDEILYDYFDIDYRFQGDGFEAKSWEPAYIGPEFQKFDDGTFKNIWGSKQKYINYGNGKYTETIDFALARAETVKEVDDHQWPQVDWYDYQSIIPAIKKFPDYPFMVGYFAPGWFAWEVRGMSQFMIDCIEKNAIAEAILTHICDFGYNYFKKIIETVKDYIGENVHCIHLADDWGTQQGLLMNPSIFDDFFAPHYRRIIDLAHSAGLKVEFHSCGSAIKIFPRFIDVGVDIMNPIQTSAKDMIPLKIKEEFGNDLVFSGGIDVQQVLPKSHPDEVKKEVISVLESMGKNGGYIPGPSHNIQVGTPPENVIAMYEALYEYFGMKINL